MSDRITLREVPGYWAARQPFNCNGTLSGRTSIEGYGRLPEPHVAELAKVASRVAYVVYSYETPIGWVLDDGTEEIPKVKYSMTTSRHQRLLWR